VSALARARELVERVDDATVPDVPALHGRLLHAQAHAAIAEAEAVEIGNLALVQKLGHLGAHDGELSLAADKRIRAWIESVVS
jgi:hypothetical protein